MALNRASHCIAANSVYFELFEVLIIMMLSAQR